MTEGWGADLVFEASGSEKAAEDLFRYLCPGGKVVYIGLPGEPVRFDVVGASVKEAGVLTIFRYAHVFPRALALMGSGKINLKPLITETFGFDESVKAFDFAVDPPQASIKSQIELRE
jgi:D-xylulose reductase